VREWEVIVAWYPHFIFQDVSKIVHIGIVSVNYRYCTRICGGQWVEKNCTSKGHFFCIFSRFEFKNKYLKAFKIDKN